MSDKKGADRVADADQAQAETERAARRLLMDLGAAELSDRPWQGSAVPPSAIDLVLFFLWRDAGLARDEGDSQANAADAALRLLPAARAELDQIETGLLFAARTRGLTWVQMAEAMGLNSPQACQQRFDRLTSRRTQPASGSSQ